MSNNSPTVRVLQYAPKARVAQPCGRSISNRKKNWAPRGRSGVTGPGANGNACSAARAVPGGATSSGAGAAAGARTAASVPPGGSAPGAASGGRLGHSPAWMNSGANHQKPWSGPEGVWVAGAASPASLVSGLVAGAPSKAPGESGQGRAAGLAGAPWPASRLPKVPERLLALGASGGTSGTPSPG